MSLIFKIVSQSEWDSARLSGVFGGVAIDLADGFIHFSTAEQVAETAAKHFSGRTDLVLVAVDSERLGEDLKWEPSRGGDLFPHLYADLEVAQAQSVRPLLLDENGVHRLDFV